MKILRNIVAPILSRLLVKIYRLSSKDELDSYKSNKQLFSKSEIEIFVDIISCADLDKEDLRIIGESESYRSFQYRMSYSRTLRIVLQTVKCSIEETSNWGGSPSFIAYKFAEITSKKINKNHLNCITKADFKELMISELDNSNIEEPSKEKILELSNTIRKAIISKDDNAIKSLLDELYKNI